MRPAVGMNERKFVGWKRGSLRLRNLVLQLGDVGPSFVFGDDPLGVMPDLHKAQKVEPRKVERIPTIRGLTFFRGDNSINQLDY